MAKMGLFTPSRVEESSLTFLQVLHMLESVTVSFFSLMLAVSAWFRPTPEFLFNVEPDGKANGACQKKVNFKLLPCPSPPRNHLGGCRQGLAVP
jgi:hypothetical protein